MIANSDYPSTASNDWGGTYRIVITISSDYGTGSTSPWLWSNRGVRVKQVGS